MIALCIIESYYITGLCRAEYFSEMKFLEQRRGQLDQSVTCWVLGEKIPKRKSLGGVNWT